MVAPLKLGIVGLSPGNGHPFSFAAIINGYDDEGMAQSGWPFIHNYLKGRHASEFGFDQVQVTHAWTQDATITRALAKASRIPHVVAQLDDMIDDVDGVIIARDDYETHFPMAKAMLERGKYVFIDKPLSVNVDELRFFKPYLESGHLMSCAAARYAKELDDLRANYDSFGDVKLIRGTVVNSMEKYGIHMLDGILGVTGFQAKSVSCVHGKHASMRIRNHDDSLMFIDALDETPITLQIDFWSDKNRFHAEVRDNFSMFRRLLHEFVQMMRTGQPPIEPMLVLSSMKVLIAGAISVKEGREVDINEIGI